MIARPFRHALLTASALALASCAANQQREIAMEAQAEAAVPAEIDMFFEQYDDAMLAMSPETKTFRGIRDADYGTWSDRSEAADEARRAMRQEWLARMRAGYDLADLSEEDRLSYRLFEATIERDALLDPFQHLTWDFDQMRGAQSSLPAFLINTHTVQTEEHAEAYVERIRGLGNVVDTLIRQSVERAAAGVMPPDWVYPYVISDIDNVLSAGMQNAVLEDFRSEVADLDLSDVRRAELIGEAEQAWANNAAPAFAQLKVEMQRQQAMAPTDDGIWRFDEGEEYYAALLKYYTTTELSADEIHAIGLREVDRIHGEMRAIMAQVGFEGTLQEFFEYTRTDDRFFHTSREDYLAEVDAVVAAMNERLPDYFITLPQYELRVQPVEAFREQSAGKAFYQSPAPDGSRPGIYYVNLYNLRDMSRNELEALAYHEANPGHHMQRAIQTGLTDLPPFRRFGGFTAYTEGWGLYSEELPKEMGFYTDPYSDFGRLGMELWRAARLVVDTGIHDQRWSREEAIAYLQANTPNPEGDIRKAIERYIVYPGQATAYMIGKLKIMELRERARTAFGDEFDIRQFHELVLRNGPVPLSILEEQVDDWIAAEAG
ncbi:DUF885 domain-containing protein [Aurantiacibacter gangjinensis]|uniref:Lipoprotein n=1 Tax=Aurantiacibacter gangjinensis TaxID=502682 RepID=A0A0G9MQF7_9SPHN|nr:DUF885 domain-containing protein [Aurantiacibacter gangjinensis]APE27472.1 protein of unknown function DUF885 [Aurantiacibacter gangjinensis]KLE31538.1 lipoprotein [Aurantiacibacter gangjinensis]